MSPCKDTATLLSIPEDGLEDTPSSPPVGTWTIRPINILPYPLRDPSLRLRLSLLLVIASFSLISILCISVELVVRHLQQLNTDAPTLLQLELDQQQLTQFGQQIEEQLQQQQRQQLGQQSESSLLFNLKLEDEPGRIVLQFGQGIIYSYKLASSKSDLFLFLVPPRKGKNKSMQKRNFPDLF